MSAATRFPPVPHRAGTPAAGAVLALALALGAGVANAAPAADFVFRNGAVYTVTTEKPWAEAVAVDADRIVYVGSATGAVDYIGKKTKVVDLAGGMLLPGFIDSHAHINSVDMVADASLTFRDRPAQDVLDALQRYVDAHPDDKIIMGTGWILESFGPAGPHKNMIDKMIPDRPAFLRALDGHHMWANSKALDIAGVTKDTPDPLPGKSWFQRDPETNEPTGFIVEGAAAQIVRSALIKHGYPIEGKERLHKGLAIGLPMLAASGITTIYDAGMKFESATYEALHELEQKNQLTLRVFGSYRYRPDLSAATQDPVRRVTELRKRYHSDYLNGASQIKIFLDGSENNYTAYMLAPYADRPLSRGLPLFSVEQLNTLIEKADAAGIDVHMHVVGDAGARMGLDAVELAARKNGSRDRRHTLSHTIFVDPSDVPRFRQLGVVWQSTPSWALMSSRNVMIRRAMGEQRFARIYPFQEALDQGAILALGSDLAALNDGVVFKPLEQIEIGHTRQRLGQPDDDILPTPSQRLNMADLIRAYTINGAYMVRMEKKIGSIEVGKQADLVVLGKNLFDVSPYEIHKTPVLLTMMDGKVVYSADARK